MWSGFRSGVEEGLRRDYSNKLD